MTLTVSDSLVRIICNIICGAMHIEPDQSSNSSTFASLFTFASCWYSILLCHILCLSDVDRSAIVELLLKLSSL